ncbi:hypothetical protein [Natrinema longum]|uniref:DUF8071 domain-containing protein n=1 Tax=Natrinema longum TaxID=370324 RepID=A0A8A2U906_9EURY|nr:hypothetical protein [Natrinema longum]MBZ6494226.1 hypothetical protein [Natrinema longum]QSW84448.1 hypothetical protein J0X27_13445 [Natrinema longum]
MSPDRNEPTVNPSEGTAFEHAVAAVKHVIAAIAVLYASFRDPVTSRSFLERVWYGVVGRRRRTSIKAILSAPALAVVTGPLVATTVGYSQIERWVLGSTYSLRQLVLGTLNGTGANAIALVGIGMLVAFAAAFAARNSGLVPTLLLVMGPVFGIGLARYGMFVEHFSPSKVHRWFGITDMHFATVGPVETLGTSLFLAFVWGIPLGVIGFVLGTLGRRVNGLLGRRVDSTGVSGT